MGNQNQHQNRIRNNQMSYCSELPLAKTIDRCFTELIIGDIGTPSESYIVHVQNYVTGTMFRYSITSGVDGIVSIDNEIEFMSGHVYEVYVTAEDDVTPLELEDPNGELFTQVRFYVADFSKNYDITTQTIEL